MSRRIKKDNSDDVSLFPFLAVLLCTMGSLIVMLVGLSSLKQEDPSETLAKQKRQTPVRSSRPILPLQAKSKVQKKSARLKIPSLVSASKNMAKSTADLIAFKQIKPKAIQVFDPAKIEAKKSQLAADKITIQQFIEKTRQERAKIDTLLTNNEQHLTDLEDHIYRLMEKIKSFQKEKSELAALESGQYDDQEVAKKHLDHLQELIRQGEKELAEAKKKGHEEKHFAIQPYQGQDGTFRRPIYIECLKDEIVLQPEGLKLTLEDLNYPLAAGSPLASVVRAAQEFYEKDRSFAEVAVAGNTEENARLEVKAYPLLIVRPEGLETFYRAKQAIVNWGSDFGYELVGAKWKVRYKASNEKLYLLERQALQVARIRMSTLAKSAPRIYGFRTIPTNSGPGGQRANGAFSGTASRSSQGAGSQGAGTQAGMGNYAGENQTTAGSQERFATSGGDQKVAFAAEQARANDLNGTPNGSFFNQTEAYAAKNQGTNHGTGLSQTGSQKNFGEARNGGQGGDFSAAQTGGEPNGQEGPACHLAQAGEGPTSQSQGAANQTAQGQSSQGQSSQGQSSQGQNSQSQNDQNFESVPPGAVAPTMAIARKEGRNWALKKSKQGRIAIRRPVQVLVREDRIVVLRSGLKSNLSAQGERLGTTIYLKRGVRPAIGDIVTAVQKNITDWGIAGHGMYWRPTLVLRVGPNGVRHAEELNTLLELSGMDVGKITTATRLNVRRGSNATR